MTRATSLLLTDPPNRQSLATAQRFIEDALALIDRSSVDASIGARLQESLDHLIAITAPGKVARAI